MRARDKRTATETSGVDVLSSKKKSKRGGGWLYLRGLRIRKSYNGTETNLLTIYKRGHGFIRVIQILIR